MVIPENVGELKRYLETFPDNTRLVLINENDEECHFYVETEDYVMPTGPVITVPAVYLNVISESDWRISPMGKGR